MNERITSDPNAIPRVHLHSIHVEGRNRLSVTGVTDVENFNEQEVCLTTDCGVLHIDGTSLHITKLNLDEGHVLLEGELIALEYEPVPAPKRGMFSKVFR